MKYVSTPLGRLAFSTPFDAETGRMVMVYRSGGATLGGWLLDRFGGPESLTPAGKVSRKGIDTWLAFVTETS